MYNFVIPAELSHDGLHQNRVAMCRRISELEMEPHTGKCLYTITTPKASDYLYSNEYHSKVWQVLRHHPADTCGKGCVVVVGHGHIPSEIREYKRLGQTIIVVDIAPLVLKHLAYEIHCLRESETIDEFMKRYCSTDNPICTYYKQKGILHQLVSDWEKQYYLHRDILQKEFFLASPRKYTACRKAARETTFCFKTLNMRSRANCAKVANVIYDNGFQVNCVNVTNLSDYDQGPEESAEDSTLVPRNVVRFAHGRRIPIIHSSVLDDYPSGVPVSIPSWGLWNPGPTKATNSSYPYDAYSASPHEVLHGMIGEIEEFPEHLWAKQSGHFICSRNKRVCFSSALDECRLEKFKTYARKRQESISTLMAPPKTTLIAQGCPIKIRELI